MIVSIVPYVTNSSHLYWTKNCVNVFLDMFLTDIWNSSIRTKVNLLGFCLYTWCKLKKMSALKQSKTCMRQEDIYNIVAWVRHACTFALAFILSM